MAKYPLVKATTVLLILGSLLCIYLLLKLNVIHIDLDGKHLMRDSQILTLPQDFTSTAASGNHAPRPYTDEKGLPLLTSNDIESLDTFTFFIGYPRSSHSIIASMIDAHPNAILAHEFNLFSKLITQSNSSKHDALLSSREKLFSALYQKSYKEAMTGWRSGNESYDKKGYSLKLKNDNGSWQGRFTTLEVIGDKAGGMTSRAYKNDPTAFKTMYKQLSNLIRIPIRVLHVVRNPYDMIATRLLYRFSTEKRRKANYTSKHRLDNPANVRQGMKALYSEAEAVNNSIRDCDMNVLEIHSEDFVTDPRRIMKRVCKFLGLQCSEGYLQMCEDSTYKSVSRTRDSLVWGHEAREFIDNQIMSFSFFKRYSFESD